jgi:hypothetical protein
MVSYPSHIHKICCRLFVGELEFLNSQRVDICKISRTLLTGSGSLLTQSVAGSPVHQDRICGMFVVGSHLDLDLTI